jgi:MFS family permease
MMGTTTTTKNDRRSSKLWAALILLRDDPTMRYLIAFNVAYSFAAAFLNSFVNGQVVAAVLRDDSYVGLLTAFHGLVAALAAFCLGGTTYCCAAAASSWSKIAILMVGSACFSLIALPTLVWPDFQTWHPGVLVFIYALEGIGRATAEGTLKALFADLFPHEKEGAFANIILQYGLASSLAYILSNQLSCVVSSIQSAFCVEYRDGSHHDLFLLSLVVVVLGLCSIVSLSLVPRCSGSTSNTSRLLRLQGPTRRTYLEMLSISKTINVKYEAMVRNEDGISA